MYKPLFKIDEDDELETFLFGFCNEYYFQNKKIIDNTDKENQALTFADFIVNNIIENQPIYFLTKQSWHDNEPLIETNGTSWMQFYMENILPIRIKHRDFIKTKIINKLEYIKTEKVKSNCNIS